MRNQDFSVNRALHSTARTRLHRDTHSEGSTRFFLGEIGRRRMDWLLNGVVLAVGADRAGLVVWGFQSNRLD